MTAGDVRFTRNEGTVVAHLTGEVDMSNSGDFASAISTAATNDVLAVVVDLSEVDYLDSAGIHLLFRLREALQSRGQRLALVIPDPSTVRDTLRLAGVADLVEIRNDLNDAVQSLTPEAGGEAEASAAS
jgi:anti-sigma B factor antagonist